MGTVPSLSILAPKLLPLYRGVVKVPLPKGLVCFAIVLHHELEWLLVLHHNRSLIALVYLVRARCAIHQNRISEALRHETHYVIWSIPDGGPNDKRLVQFFLKFYVFNELIKGTCRPFIYRLHKYSPITTRRLESYSNCVVIHLYLFIIYNKINIFSYYFFV